MGGIVSAPSPVVQVAAAPQPSVDEQTPSKDTAAARRGRSGTIQTSERGLIQVKPQLAQKKSLLGE